MTIHLKYLLRSALLLLLWSISFYYFNFLAPFSLFEVLPQWGPTALFIYIYFKYLMQVNFSWIKRTVCLLLSLIYPILLFLLIFNGLDYIYNPKFEITIQTAFKEMYILMEITVPLTLLFTFLLNILTVYLLTLGATKETLPSAKN